MTTTATTQGFLMNAASLFINGNKGGLPPSSSSVLHSYFSSRLNNDSTRPTCHHCNSDFTNSCNLKIVPKRVMSKRIKKLLLKSEISTQLLYGNKFQASLLKNCIKNSGNKLIITCLVCQKKNVRQIVKPMEMQSQRLISSDSNNKHSEDRAIKKKKKRDKLVGLKAFAVQEANLINAKFDTVSKSNKVQSKIKKVANTEPIITSVLVPEPTNLNSFSLQSTDTIEGCNFKRTGKRKNLENMSKVSKLIEREQTCVKKVFKDVPATMLIVGKKFKKGSKLQAMLATADAAKQSQKKKEKKTNFLDSLQLLLEK